MYQNNPHLELSSFWKRAVAYLLDLTLLTVITIAIGYLCFILSIDQAIVIGFIFALFAPVFYFSIMHSLKGKATLGKQLMKIQVVCLDGNKLGFWRAFGREWARFILSILALTYWFALFSNNKQTLHDMMAKTVVICKPAVDGADFHAINPTHSFNPAYSFIPDVSIDNNYHNIDDSTVWVLSGFAHNGNALRVEVNNEELLKGVVIGGRSKSGTQFVLPDTTISGTHLYMRLLNDSLILTDLGSTNGTFVDNAKLVPNREYEVKLHSRIQLGGSAIQVSKR